MTETLLLGSAPHDIAKAARLLGDGQLVALPTETVYGLGADARDSAACAKIFEAKGRPNFNPLIVHVADLDMAQNIGIFDDLSLTLAQAFWPGPLTLVVPVRDGAVSPLVTAGHSTVAIRVPAHPVAQSLLQEFAGPLAAPSANPSGQVSATSASHVSTGLGGKIAAIIDAGPCIVGLESTILSSKNGGTLLRVGGLDTDKIEAVLGHPLVSDTTPAAVSAPGQLASHYAPNGTVRLNVTAPLPQDVFVGFGPMDCDINLSETGDLVEAASRLFDTLHFLNAQEAKYIAVAPIPNTGLGQAINDRLTRAAAPR